MILRPAVRRSRRPRKAGGPKGGRRRAGGLPSKKDWVDTGMQLGFRGTREQLEADYDKQIKAYRAKKRKG